MGIKTEYVPVAQLDRVTDSDSVGRTFESCQARHKNPRKQDVFGGFAMLAKAIPILQNCGIYYDLCAEGGGSCQHFCANKKCRMVSAGYPTGIMVS